MNIQIIPLHRVILSLGFCSDSLQLCPLCVYSVPEWRYAFSKAAL